MTNTPERIAAYKKILDRFSILEGGHSGAEDAQEFLDGEGKIQRFCLVTVGFADSTLYYAYPNYANIEEAAEFAFENIADDIYPESPYMIVDLDTGKEYEPNYSKITWEETGK